MSFRLNLSRNHGEFSTIMWYFEYIYSNHTLQTNIFLVSVKTLPRRSAYLHIMANLAFRTVFSDAELLEAKHKLIICADISAFYFYIS